MLQCSTWLKARPELSTQRDSQTVPALILRALWPLLKSPLHNLGVKLSKHTVSSCHWWQPTLDVTEQPCWWFSTYSLSSVNWEVSCFSFLILVKETSRKLHLVYVVHVTFLLNEAALETSPLPATSEHTCTCLSDWDMASLWWHEANSLQANTQHLPG